MSLKRPLRIALISPKGPLYRSKGGIFGKSLRYKPLTLTTLAALVPDDLPHELVLIDEGIEEVPADLDVDLAGLTVITGTAPRAYELSAGLRRRCITTVLGGPHVTLDPMCASGHADTIVVGYAEETWPQLLRDFAAGELKPRYDQAPALNLAGTPRPRRDLLPRRRYLTDNVFEATRGCVHDCDFCVVPSAWGRRPLQKPVAEVADDVRRHLDGRRDRRAIFVDLNLIADRRYARELFAALTPLHIRWYGLATTLIGRDDGLLDAAAESGCRGLLVGFESVSGENLDLTRKGFNRPEDYAALVAKLHAKRIAVQGCFTFGLDHDEPDDFERTARFAVEAKIDLPRFAVVTPFPGTALHRRLEAEGRITDRDLGRYDGQHVVFRPAKMTADQLQRGTESAWKQAYSLPNIARRLWHSPAPLPVRLATNFGYRHYAHRLHKFYHCDSPANVPNWPTVPLTIGGRRIV
jgi:radical SAM superfamily enzyme YgiQ (UPF0313 family)